MKKVDRSFSIILRAIILNSINIVRLYPKMRYMAKHPDKYTIDERHNYGLKVVKSVVNACHMKIVPYGLENIPKDGGCYLCANHQEKFDPLAVWYTYPRQLGVILNDAACHRPFIKELCMLIKSQRLVHNNMHSILSSFSNVTNELKNGFSYLVFPEGDYEPEYNKLSNFHTGCFKSPQRAHSPIIPVVIKNSFRIFDKGFRTTKPIEVHYLEPIYYDTFKDLSTKELTNLVRDRIEPLFVNEAL